MLVVVVLDDNNRIRGRWVASCRRVRRRGMGGRALLSHRLRSFIASKSLSGRALSRLSVLGERTRPDSRDKARRLGLPAGRHAGPGPAEGPSPTTGPSAALTRRPRFSGHAVELRLVLGAVVVVANDNNGLCGCPFGCLSSYGASMVGPFVVFGVVVLGDNDGIRSRSRSFSGSAFGPAVGRVPGRRFRASRKIVGGGS